MEARDALAEVETAKARLQEEVAVLTAQVVALQSSSKQRVSALEGQLKESEIALSELTKQNGLLYSQVNSLTQQVEKSMRPQESAIPEPSTSASSGGTAALSPCRVCIACANHALLWGFRRSVTAPPQRVRVARAGCVLEPPTASC